MKAANEGVPFRDWQHARVLPRVADALRRAPRVLCVMHAGPDGDACGSTLALALGLRDLGHETTTLCSTGVPAAFRFLPGADTVLREVPPGARFDAACVCDAGAFARIGPGLPPREALGTLVNVDHHLTSDGFGDLNYVDPAAAAAGVLVARLLRDLGHRLTSDVATALYASVLTDTGSFRYSSTDPEALRLAADLVEAGADPWRVSSGISENHPCERLHLLRDVLATLELSGDGRFASLVVTRAMMQAVGAGEDLLDGFVNYARGIRGVEVAAQVGETDQGWHVSFRSRGKADVSRVAVSLGGGGHRNAAGALLHGDLAGVRTRVAEAVGRELARIAPAPPKPEPLEPEAGSRL